MSIWTKRREAKEDAYYDELIKQRLAEVLRSHIDDEKLDRAVLDAWIAEDNRRRAEKRKRIMTAAACILVLCTGVFSIKLLMEADDTIAVAGNGDDVVNRSGNNLVIKNNREDVDENIGGEVVVVTNWDKVKDLQKQYPDMLVPGYVPKGYAFSRLEITDKGNTTEYVYSFYKGIEKIEIRQVMGIELTSYYEYDRAISSGETELMIKDDTNKVGFCRIIEGTIFIRGNCSDEEMLNIADDMQ